MNTFSFTHISVYETLVSPTYVHNHTAIENGKTTTKIVLWQSLLPDKWNITLAGKTSILILEGDVKLERGGYWVVVA